MILPSEDGDFSRQRLDRLIDDGGYERCDPSIAESRFLLTRDAAWLTLLSAESAGYVTEYEWALAETLSKTGGPVLIMALADSDEFVLIVFDKGKQVDSFATNALHAPPKIKKVPATKRPRVWKDTFQRELPEPTLRAMFESTGPFTDEYVDRVCRVLGICREHTTLDPILAADEENELCVRRKRTSSADSATHDRTRTIPNQTWEMLVGERRATIHEVTLMAAELDQPVLEISGTAVTDGIVEPIEVSGVWHGGIQHVRRSGARRFACTPIADESGMWHARLEDLNASAFAAEKITQVTLALNAAMQAKVAGQGALTVSFRRRPDDSTPRALLLNCGINARLATWIPDGAELNDGTRALNVPTNGLAVVIVPADLTTVARIKPWIESWIRHVAASTGAIARLTFEGQMTGVNFHVPRKTKKFAMSEIQSKAWEKFFANPAALQTLIIELLDGSSEQTLGGATLQGPCQRELHELDTLSVGLWHRAGNGIASECELSGIVDSMFAELQGLQAWQACWDWVPLFSRAEDNAYSPYEEAKGLGSPSQELTLGTGYMLATWSARFLRGIGESIWLGPEMCKHLSLREVNEIAETEIRNHGVRLRLRQSGSLSQLEAALRSILPG